jgi:hypothetical protein
MVLGMRRLDRVGVERSSITQLPCGNCKEAVIGTGRG